MKNIFKIVLLTVALVMLLSAFSTLAVSATDADAVSATEAAEEPGKNGVDRFYTDDEGNHILVLEDGKEYVVNAEERATEEIGESKTVAIKFDTSNLGTSLTYMWQGMLCIFIVIAVIILAVILMNFFSDKASARKKIAEDRDSNEN